MIALAVLGWLAAIVLAVVHYRHTCGTGEADTISYLVLVDKSGSPISLRKRRGSVPTMIPKPHGKGPATAYRYVGTAAIYQDQP